jgi:hypothetical protein
MQTKRSISGRFQNLIKEIPRAILWLSPLVKDIFRKRKKGEEMKKITIVLLVLSLVLVVGCSTAPAVIIPAAAPNATPEVKVDSSYLGIISAPVARIISYSGTFPDLRVEIEVEAPYNSDMEWELVFNIGLENDLQPIKGVDSRAFFEKKRLADASYVDRGGYEFGRPFRVEPRTKVLFHVIFSQRDIFSKISLKGEGVKISPSLTLLSVKSPDSADQP